MRLFPKNTGHSILRQGTPGFPLAPDFSSTEVGHLKLFEELGDWSSPFILPGSSSLFFHLCHLGLLRKDGSQQASQCQRSETPEQNHMVCVEERSSLPLSHWLGNVLKSWLKDWRKPLCTFTESDL